MFPISALEVQAFWAATEALQRRAQIERIRAAAGLGIFPPD
jgi:hypothetical protein